MSENATTAQPRTVATVDRGKLDIKALVLLAILLAAGFILNMFVGKAISGATGGMISPEFIISAFCLTILVVRPNIGQALVIGLISAAVIQITTTSPFIDFAAEGVAAVVMALIVKAGMKTPGEKDYSFGRHVCDHGAFGLHFHGYQDGHDRRGGGTCCCNASRCYRHGGVQRHSVPGA